MQEPTDTVLHLQELWELNLTTRRWTKSQMKGDIPEQLVSSLDLKLSLLYQSKTLSGFSHSSSAPLSPWSDACLRRDRSSFWFDDQQHGGGLPARDPAVLQAGRRGRSRPADALIWAGGDHGPGAGPVLHGGRHQRVQLLHGRERARPPEFPASMAVTLSAVWAR